MNKAKPFMNFFMQTKKVEQFIKFRHRYLIDLAKQYGATFKNFTPDSCDMIFPNKESMEAFEKVRDEYTKKKLAEESVLGKFKDLKDI